MGAHPAEEIGEIEVLLDLMRDHLEIDRPADLTPAELEQLLLRIYPAQDHGYGRVTYRRHDPGDERLHYVPRRI